MSIGNHADDQEQEALIKEYIGYLKPSNVLEMGCGKGRLAKYCSNYIGIDKNSDFLKEVKEQGIKCMLMDGRSLAFPDKSFDMSFSCTVLMHDKHGETIIKEMLRISKRFVLFIESKTGFRWVYRHDYQHLAEQAGFEMWDYRSLRTPAPFRLALWLFRRKRTKLP